MFDSDFTIMTKYMKFGNLWIKIPHSTECRVWNFNPQISKLTEYLSLNHPFLRDLNQQENNKSFSGKGNIIK